jgi:2'-5' RNA ligase
MVAERIRAFVALALPEEARELLLQAQAELLQHAGRSPLAPRAVRPAQLHLTLKFLGDLAAGQVEYLAAELRAAAQQHAPIDTALTAWSAFPSERRARVIAAELDDSGGLLAKLAARFDRAGVAVGLLEEARRFRPHVTLIRLKRPGDVSAWLTPLRLPSSPARLEHLVLYRSQLRPAGPIYTAVEQAHLVAGR